MSIRVHQEEAEFWLPWRMVATCRVCDPTLSIRVPVQPQIIAQGVDPLQLAFEVLKRKGWQIEPTRCPEHAGVVS